MWGHAVAVGRCSPSILAIVGTFALCGCIDDHETEDDDSGGDTSEGEHEDLLASRQDSSCEASAPDVPLLVLLSFATRDEGFRQIARKGYDEKVAQSGGARQLG